MSPLVINSGYDPPVCSKSDRLRDPSSVDHQYTDSQAKTGKCLLTNSESLCNTWEIPDLKHISWDKRLAMLDCTYWLDGELGHCQLTRLVQADFSIGNAVMVRDYRGVWWILLTDDLLVHFAPIQATRKMVSYARFPVAIFQTFM